MSMELFFGDRVIRQRLRAGPLACDLDGFASWLDTRGYATATARDKLRLVSRMSRWLDRQALTAGTLDESLVQAFLSRHGRQRRGDAATCKQLLSYLRNRDRIRPAPPPADRDGPMDRIEQAYQRFLITERGLSESTLTNYLPVVRAFLTERFGTDDIQLQALVAQDVTRFILRHAQRCSRSRAKLMVTALRSFLRFLHQRGDTAVNLGNALPPLVNWRLSGLPKSLTRQQVESLLATCDRDKPAGRRDYAILLLLARLGLRAGEIVAMTLDDFDWEAGVMTVRGKGDRHEPLPLAQDLGEALVSYLQAGRPVCATRRVFVRLRAPHCGFSTSAAIDDVVRRALARAGIDPPFKGAHLLRHSLATQMLRQGASLEEIGQILRHRHPLTTQIYAKVDLESLRGLAQPWPGGAA